MNGAEWFRKIRNGQENRGKHAAAGNQGSRTREKGLGIGENELTGLVVTLFSDPRTLAQGHELLAPVLNELYIESSNNGGLVNAGDPGLGIDKDSVLLQPFRDRVYLTPVERLETSDYKAGKAGAEKKGRTVLSRRRGRHAAPGKKGVEQRKKRTIPGSEESNTTLGAPGLGLEEHEVRILTSAFFLDAGRLEEGVRLAEPVIYELFEERPIDGITGLGYERDSALLSPFRDNTRLTGADVMSSNDWQLRMKGPPKK